MTDHELSEDAQLEQKLAAHRPRLLREVEIVCETIPVTNKFRHYAALHSGFYSCATSKIKPHITACVCCFVLGAVTMFLMMTCCFDHTPVRSQPVVASRSPQTYTVPLQMQDLDGVTSPADLMVRIRRQPTISVAGVRSEELGVRSYLYSDGIAQF